MNSIPLGSFSLKSRHDILIKVTYVVFQQMDLFMTVFAISRGSTELNPFMRSLLANPFQLVTIKIIIPVILAWVVPGKFLLPALLFILFVNALNTFQLFRLFGL
ncbi:MAG: DUF5658 family protein [Dehalococcoidales bacterium]|nr:DUF5658 family protein [Dehalococcoidales bacterium]